MAVERLPGPTRSRPQIAAARQVTGRCLPRVNRADPHAVLAPHLPACYDLWLRFPPLWACSAAGSAPEWHSGGHRFDPGQVHHPSLMDAGEGCPP
jgi:hypothetical protein